MLIYSTTKLTVSFIFIGVCLKFTFVFVATKTLIGLLHVYFVTILSWVSSTCLPNIDVLRLLEYVLVHAVSL